MLDVELFLGFALDPLFLSQLELANQALVGQYIQETDNHLRIVPKGNMQFLGKKIPKLITLAELEQLETNIYSVLKKIVPDFAYDETPLYLFSLTPDG